MKKLSLIFTLALASICTTGCDFLDDIFPKKEDEKPETVKPQSIILDSDSVLLDVEEHHQIIATVMPLKAKQEVLFTEYSTEILHVDETGLVVAENYGTTDIKVSCKEDASIYTFLHVEVKDTHTPPGPQTTYTVTYNPNGGVGNMVDANSPYTPGSIVTVLENNFTKNEYEFVNFNTSLMGTGTPYNPGSTFTISNNVTLYAQWKKTSIDPDDYYGTIDDSLSGNDLLNALRTLNNGKKTKTVGYDGMKTFSAISDVDPNGSGKIIGFYDNSKIGPNWDSGKTWNREHVWPNSRGGSKVDGDAHMTRPASKSTNSDRGSKGFGEDSYDPGKTVAYYRGVASRIIFYCVVANSSLKLSEDPFNHDYSSADPSDTMGCLSDMLKWNLEYLPSDTSFVGENDLAQRVELNRNDAIEKHKDGQGNRNPFIDHPEYACKIWGNTNDATRKACGIH